MIKLKEYIDKRKRHGLSKHPLYKVYKGMVNRCTRKTAKGYKDYGGNGITIDERWLGKDGFLNFFADMSADYLHGLTLERPKNKDPYGPDTCIWATPYTQARNKSSNIWVLDGETQMILKDFCAKYKLGYQSARRYLILGRSVDFIKEHTKKRK